MHSNQNEIKEVAKIVSLNNAEKALPEILVLTHGYFGKELIKSAEMIVGTIERVSFIPLITDFSVADYRDMVGKAIEQMKEGSIILVDLFGGTPFNTAAQFSRDMKLNIIVGVNLSVLIESVLLRTNHRGRELCEKVLESTQRSIQLVNVENSNRRI